MINIQYIPIFKDNYIWLIVNNQEGKVIAIDPGDAKPLLQFLKTHQLKLEAVLITHHHFDHTNGIEALKNAFDINIYGPKNEDIRGLTHAVDESDKLLFSCLNTPFTILNIPGHTLHHIAYLLPNMIFCGDTLFSAGCGRIFEGTAEQMYHSLQTIAALPDPTNVYCTHEYTLQNLKFAELVEPNNANIQTALTRAIKAHEAKVPTLPTQIREEKKINPFLRCHQEAIKKSVEDHTGLKLDSELDVFKYLREWKNLF